MTELQKMIVQASNEVYKSDLMKSFVSDYKGQLSQSVGADPGYLGVSMTGARFFAPLSTTASASNTAATTTATPCDTTDNANANVLIQEDNAAMKSTGGESNRNTITTSTSAAATTTATEEDPDPNANMSEVAAVLAEVRGAVPETKQVLLQQMTEAAVDAHRGTCINTLKAVQEARARFGSSTQAAGPMPDMSKVSQSATAMWEKMKEQMMPELAKTITFFKQLPGFVELCLDDQMLLIKQGTFEVMMTRFSMLIDHEKNTMLDPTHRMVCPREVIKKMPMGEFLDGFFQVGASFNPIGLKDNEIGVFTAVLAFSPSRPGLKEPRLVSTLQSLYLRALFSLMKQNHSDAEAKFSRVLGLAPMFRRMGEDHSKALGTMEKQAPGDFDKQFTPVHKEMYVKDQ